ncbi:hypothetical protein PIB30_044995 [Stylosanthes scabra]|uniref:Uncharacterized protein n=1 Tax=Stylosanthes scabra TaxID=79078 RepID=A0ABU6XEV8_9FABA|nr:hypothetical protein [Stylosanthes scabra]
MAESVATFLNQISNIQAHLGHNNGSSISSTDQTNRYFIYPSENPDISKSVISKNLAYEIWSEPKRTYYHGDRFRIVELKEKLYAAK